VNGTRELSAPLAPGQQELLQSPLADAIEHYEHDAARCPDGDAMDPYTERVCKRYRPDLEQADHYHEPAAELIDRGGFPAALPGS
jgi:hypothetical protein